MRYGVCRSGLPRKSKVREASGDRGWNTAEAGDWEVAGSMAWALLATCWTVITGLTCRAAEFDKIYASAASHFLHCTGL